MPSEVSSEFRCNGCNEVRDSLTTEPGGTYRGPCPKCGATGITGYVLARTEVRHETSLGIEVRDDAGRRWLKGFLRHSPTATGPTAGTKAWVEQFKDTRNKRYRKKVTLSDGTVVKDVDGPLSDQTLHGPQDPRRQ